MDFETSKEVTFIMGYEESYSYLVGNNARNKDGVVSAIKSIDILKKN